MTIYIEHVDDVNVKVTCDKQHVALDLNNFFSFEAPNARFDPRVKKKLWNGIISLYNMNTKMVYRGLIPYVYKYAHINNENIVIDPKLLGHKNNFEIALINKFAEKLRLSAGGNAINPRDFQAEAVRQVVNNNRMLIISPTASGKSLIIYMLVRWYLLKIPDPNKKILIIVPTTSLVGQMVGDFKDYSTINGWDAVSNCHAIKSGVNKYSAKRVFVSTWQSIYKMNKDYFSQFGAVFGDEAHQFKAANIGGIMKKLVDCPIRVGLTATVSNKNAPVNVLTLEGLFGRQFVTITTKELMLRGDAAQLTVCVMNMVYPESEARDLKGARYADEIKYITTHRRRNSWIVGLAKSATKNMLILFQNVSHGEHLYERIKEACPNRNVYLHHGGIDADERNADRAKIEKDKDAILIASYGTTSTGVSIKNIHSVVSASSMKSSIKLLQTIGRGLRLSKTKSKVNFYDLVDNFRVGEHENYALKHYMDRFEIYTKQGFDYRVTNLRI